MEPGLIEQRHPLLGILLRAWETGCADVASLPETAAAITLILHRGEDGWKIVQAGSGVSRLYGCTLGGCPAAVLAPDDDSVAKEADVASETGRPLLMESEIAVSGRRCRVARLCIPGPVDRQILCGIVECEQRGMSF